MPGTDEELGAYLERARHRPISEPVAKPDDYSSILRETSQRAAAVYISQAGPPERVAETNRIARSRGLPVPMVDNDLSAMQELERVDSLLAIGRRNPRFADWLGSNPRAAAAATDDHRALGHIASAFDPAELSRGWSIRAAQAPEPTLWNAMNGVWRSLVGGFDQMNAGIDLAMLDWAPRLSFMTSSQQRAFGAERRRDVVQDQSTISMSTPGFQSRTGAAVYSGVSSLAQMTPAILASIATRSPAPAVAMAGLMSGTGAYAKYRARGGTPGEAAAGAGIEGGAEALFELLPMSTLAHGFGKGATGRFIGEFVAKELATEELTTLVQDASDTAIANPGKTWSQFWAERPGAAYDTAVATLVGSGVIGGLSGVASRSQRRQSLYANAEAEGHFIDTLAEGAAVSKVRPRDPQAFRSLIDHLTAGMVTDKVYIPADAVRAYQQSEGFEDNEFWRQNESKIAEAETTGGDFVLPLSDAITNLADKGAWAALRHDMRLSAGGLSRSEAESLADEQGNFDSDMAGMLQERSNDARSRLFANVFDKLTDAGYTANAARTQAELTTAHHAALASWLGQDLTGDEFSNVAVEQVLPEKLKQAAKADATDLVINALRRGHPSYKPSGLTLLDWISHRGGLNDTGGELAAIGADKWHQNKAFRRKLIRPFDVSASMGGITGAGDYGLDSTLRAAISEGYFPELEGYGDAYGKDSHDTQKLLDAISDELAGNPRHVGPPQVDSVRQAAEELRQLLEDAGRDPSTMSDPEIRQFIDRFEKGDQTGRSYASGERGRILFAADGKATIQLFRSRNLSTFLHESGHLILENLKRAAASEDAPESLKLAWQTVQDWFAENGHPMVMGEIPGEAHELWARGFERYLMEGKSPSVGLNKVFETVRSWLVGLYRRVANLKSPISDEVRAVMDRLLATEDEIAEKRQEQSLDPMFRSFSDAGMTSDEFNAYMELVASAKTAAESELLAKAIAGFKARETAQYREWETETRAEVTRAVDARPEFRALDLVRSAPLNRQWIVDRFGADAPSLMPAGVPPSVKEGGAHPDSIAEAAGLASGHEMIEVLMGLEKRRRELRQGGDKRTVRQVTIDAQTSEIMAERYGDPFVTGEAEEDALAAVHNDLQGEVIAAEVRALARRTGKHPTPYSMAREWALRRVRSGEVRDHVSGAAIQQYRRAAAMNARAAFEAVSEGHFADAFRHKQAQLVNNALVRQARDTKKEVDTAVRRLDRIASRKKFDGVNQDYLELAHRLLEQVDLKRRSDRQVERQQSFEAWASEREAEGHTIVVPKSFAAYLGKTNWTKLSADDLLGLDDAVRQVLHLGRLKQTLIDRQEEREHDAVVAEALTTMERLPQKPEKGFEDPTRWENVKVGVLGAAASLLKMETVFKRLDGGGHGAFNRVVYQPIAAAQAEEHRMMREVLDELEGHLAKLPPKVLATWNDQIEIPQLGDPRTHEPMRGPRSRLISVALNMGNESNAAKLAGGYGWREDTIMRVLDQQLAPEEWLYVQNVWDTIERLWPKIAALERRVNGVVPDKVRPRTLNTSAGILRGGYFPVVYDPSRSRTAGEQAGKAEGKLFENNYTRASTSRGFTKERTEVERPILLSLDVVNRHVAEVIHDLTHREPIMQADRFLSDNRVLDAVDETLGKDVSSLFRPWLQFIANEWSYDRAGVSKLEAFMRAARRNTTFVGMGYRVGTMLAQIGGYANSVERIGPKWVAVGLNATLRHPRQANAFAMERSLELKSRFETLERDIRENVRKYVGKHDPVSMAWRYAYSGIGAFDRLVAVPTWIGAYNKAIAGGLEEQQAVHEADSALRESQGAGAAKDLAAIQRGRGPAGELGKALTMFYSFQSANYNRYVELAWDAGDAWRARKPQMVPELAARAMLLTVVAPVLSAILSGQGPDDDHGEGWAEWALKQSLYGIAAPIVLARDIVPVAVSHATGGRSYGYRFTPIAGIGESVDRVAGDVNKLRQGKSTKRGTRDLLEAVGYTTGLVPGQAAATAQFFVDVVSGSAEPKSAKDWWHGATKGRLEEQTH